MKSRRFILESLLLTAGCARDAVQAESGPFLHVDASKHKYSQAKVIYGYCVAGSKDATRCSDPLPWLVSANSDKKSPIRRGFLLFSSNGVYKYGNANPEESTPPARDPTLMMTGRDSRLLAEQRRRKILELIEQKGQITVRELVERFSVSSVTARADLDALCSQGMAVRSHGGAVRRLGANPDSPSDSREAQRYADVARLAKVSVTAVSRIANGSAKVAPSVQATVLTAARRLGITLAAKRSRTITFILGNRDTVNEFQPKVLRGAEVYCAQHNWDLHFISSRFDLATPLGSLRLPEALMRSNRPSGVILTGTHSASILAALSE